jgi:hypothetical protein
MSARAQNLKPGSRSQKRTFNRAKKHYRNGLKEVVSYGVVEGAARVVEASIPEESHLRIPSKNECEPCK